MSNINLITTCSFQGHPYLVKMNVVNGFLELVITDKYSGEEWECSYDATYIESVTRKTGNYKQFEIFITMLKSGLLKVIFKVVTTESIALDLLTYEDLESFRIRRLCTHYTTRLKNNSTNRRYLIVTYCVEFDKINYPLPLEYCGPPDPMVLQATVRKLESELIKTKQELIEQTHGQGKANEVQLLEKRIDELTNENLHLREEVKQLSQIISSSSRKPKSEVHTLQKAIIQLERNVKLERSSHHRLVEKLQKDKTVLENKLEKVKGSEKLLKEKLQHSLYSNTRVNKNIHNTNVRTIFQRTRSPLLKHTTQRGYLERSRSASPRLTGDELDRTSVENLRIFNKSKSRSRSNSRASSTRRSEKDEYLNLPLIDLRSPVRSRKTSPRSNNASPRRCLEKEQTRKYKTPSVVSKDSATTVKMLENRIRKLMHN